MTLQKEQVHAVIGAIWLFGLAILFYTDRWWPFLLFVVGLTAIVEGLFNGRGWRAWQAGAGIIGFGVWALTGFALPFLFVLLGVAVLARAFMHSPMVTAKPGAPYETDLE